MAEEEHLRTAKAGLIRALEIAEKLLDGFPIPGAKGTIGAVLEIIREAERTTANAELYKDLTAHLQSLNDELLQPLDGKPEDYIPTATRAAVEKYAKRIEDGLQQLRRPEMDKYGRLRRWIHSKEMEGDIRKVMETIQLNTDSFIVGGILRVELAIQQVERLQTKETQNNEWNQCERALDKLRCAPEAKHDSNKQPLDENCKLLLCFKGTRVAVINEITNWINDPNSPPIFWLHGLAGTGKSTIARTIGVKAEEAGYTTASFFFSRTGTAARRDPAYVFPTLAHQLAASRSELHQIIGGAVIKSPDINTAVAFKQFNTLIGNHLHTFSKVAANILIVLDALDECQGIEDKRPQEILTSLRDYEYQAACRIRIFLTSRPEQYLRHVLVGRRQVVEYDLHQDDGSAQGDIARFLKAKLLLIPEELGIPVENWPQEGDVKMLSEKSGHLFIFAKTALRFIGDDQVSDPQQQMKILLGMDQAAVDAYSPLDELYLQVLETAFSRGPDDVFLRFRRVVGFIILSQDTLPISTIATILDYRVGQVMATLLRLHSVILSSPPGTIDQPNSDHLPRAYHPSFPDFLVDSKRCSNHNFTIIQPEMHLFIVCRCFELMKPILHRNILKLHDTYVLNRDIPDLEAKVQSHITPAAAYACQFWLSHFLESEIDDSILRALYGFLSERFLWWCEALSLLDSACGGQKRLLATVAFRLQTAWEKMVNASCNPETLDLLNDAYRFLFSNHQAISESAMHTYYSALPFTPHSTRLYQLYKQETSHSIDVLQGLSPTWSSSLSTLSFGWVPGRNIFSISPDGMWLAVGQREVIKILDARTTASQCQFSLTEKVACLAFSPSESTLATVTSEHLELWNTTTGINQSTQTLGGTDFHAVAFSPQGKYLLLSIDQGLHLHHGTDAGELSVLLTGWSHKKIIFASNDEQVITGSKEGYIHFFTLSGNRLSEIQERRISYETEVEGLALRHDGKRLALYGADWTIRIYDLPSQLPIATLQLQQPEHGGTLWAIAYHPTEDELAVGQDLSVILWRQKEMPSDWTPSIHSNHSLPITEIAYCQNGTQMYTNTLSGEVKLWTTMVAQVQEPPKHTHIVNCYAVNHPTSLLATGSQDGAIILWDFTTGDRLKTFLSHTDWIMSLIFSDDDVLLASGSRDGTTIVWDVASGNCLHQLGPHTSCRDVLAFSEDNARLTTRIDNECFVWELKSGERLGRRDRDLSVIEAHTYFLQDMGGWQTVVSASQRKKCKYGLCRPPGEHRPIRTGPISGSGDRAALLCADGRVLILDISRMMHLHTDPANF